MGSDRKNLNPRSGSAPIPPMRLNRMPSSANVPIKVKVMISEQPQTHPVQVLVAQKRANPKPKRRRNVRVLIANHTPFWKRPPAPMTQPRSPKSWKVPLLITTLLLGSMALVGGGGWLAAQYIFNPDSLNWLNRNKLAAVRDTAQTLKEIGAEAAKAKLSVGSPVYVSTYPGFEPGAIGSDDILLPIFSSSIQDKMTELRVYRQTKLGNKTAFELKDRIVVEGPDEAEAIAPLTASAELIQGSNRPLALKDIDFVEGKAPAAGIWFQLSGDWERSGSQVVYGRVIQYDPTRARFHTLLNWTSPAAQLAHWQQVTGDAETELFVDQTVGLEPHFQVYQIKVSQANPLQLEPIALTKPAVNSRTYENALLLAQNGLWAAALELLTQVKQNGDWSPTAQAQLDLVKLHAQATKAQADRTWASPTQQILALLMDGRWAKALTQIKTSHTNGYDTSTILSSNATHLFQRVEAALAVNPGDGDVLRWGALIVAIEHSNRDAVIWLQKHQAPTEIQQVLALLNPLPGDVPMIQNVGDGNKPLAADVKEKKAEPVRSSPVSSEFPSPEPLDLGTEPMDLSTPEPEPLPEAIAPPPQIQPPVEPEVVPKDKNPVTPKP
jgi:hypothetical protein